MAVLPSPYGSRRTPQGGRPLAAIDPKSASLQGQALEGFGDTMSRVGERMQEQQSSLEIANAKSEFLRARLSAEREIPQGQDYRTWQKEYEKRLRETQAELSATITGERAKQAFQLDTETDIIRGNDRMLGEARRAEVDQGRAHLDQLVENNLNSALEADDTDVRQQFLGTTREAIDAAEGRGYLTAQEATAMRRGVAEDYAKRRLSMLDPEARLAALGGAPQGQLSTEVVAIIEAHGGENATILKRMAVLESAGDPGAYNKSGAAGLFQFMPPTAAQYGLSDPYDATASTIAANQLLEANRGALTGALGREPSGGELYLAHQQGAGGAIALLRDPDANVVDALAVAYDGNRERAKQAVIQNGGKTSMSAGSFAGLWVQKFNAVKGYGPSEPSPDRGLARYLPADDVAVLRKAAERDVQREMERVRDEYVSGFESYLSAISSGADVSPQIGNRYSDAVINATIPEADQRELLKQTRDDAIMQAGFAREMLMATPDEIAGMAGQLETDGEVTTDVGVILAPSRERAEQAFIEAAQMDAKRRQEDAATYVMHDDAIRKAAEDVQENPGAYARMTLLEQSRIGIPAAQQRILTKGMAEAYAAQFNEMSPDVAAQSVKEFRDGWGKNGPKVVKEMSDAGLAPEYAVAMRHSNNPGLAAEIVSLRGQTKTDLSEGVPPTSITDMDRELEEELSEFRAAFEAGDFTGQALATFNLNYGVAERLAVKYMRGGMDPSTAVEKVTEKLFPETPINDPDARLILPQGFEEGSVMRRLDAQRQVEEIRKAKPIPLDDPRLPEFADLEVMLNSAESRGVWLNNSTGDGAVLHLDVGGYLLPIQVEGGGYYEVKFSSAIGPASRNAINGHVPTSTGQVPVGPGPRD